MINWRLISHPMNWLVIIMMLVIAGTFGHLLLTLLEQEPALKDRSDLPQGLSMKQYDTDPNLNPIVYGS